MDREKFFEDLKKWADQLWAAMNDQNDKVWTRKRAGDYLNSMFGGYGPSVTTARLVLERVHAEHPDSIVKGSGANATFTLVDELSDPFHPCRSTQHCAYHGWCHRCAKEFYAVMNDVNRAIAEGGATEGQRGPLYHEVAKALMPYFLEGE